MLERAVGLDANYAPAWGWLGTRYYWDSQYSNGGEAMFQKSNTALERALTLDPNLMNASVQIIANRVERGELARAYKDADDLVKRHPSASFAHFARAYVLRYAGLLDESSQECDKSMALDSGNFGLRSCSLTFSAGGNPRRAIEFLRLDAGSDWSNRNTARLLMSQGKLAEARELVQRLPAGSAMHEFVKTCLEHPSAAQSPSTELDQAARAALPLGLNNPDSENRYIDGTYFAACGQKDSALRLLKAAIDGNYCAYAALQRDPMLTPLRSAREFPQLLSAAKQCQDNFLSQRAQLSH
jgi:tetratricopeptide (TPR) repeat protein